MLVDFLRRVQGAGLRIDHVYDVGACDGAWSLAMRARALPHAGFFLFEANPAYARSLGRTGFRSYCGTALSNPGRSQVEFFNGTNTGDSYYKETTRFYDQQGSITLPCTTLDALKRADGLPTPQFIKIDTQGSELDILCGAESFIRDVDLVYTECPIIRYNAGAPNIQDYLDYFRNRQFIPIDIFEIHRAENTLLQVDIMFMRKEYKERLLGPNDFVRPLA
jgi:FkbM family methyltransferase